MVLITIALRTVLVMTLVGKVIKTNVIVIQKAIVMTCEHIQHAFNALN